MLADVIALLTGLCGAIGGFLGGRSTRWQTAASINQLLESRMDLLEQDNANLREKCEHQQMEIDALKGVVTQKAEIAELKQIVLRIEGTLNDHMVQA